MIAQALKKHEASIARYLNDFNQNAKLKPESGGSTGYIKDTYFVEYSIPGLNKWLHQNGFSYKKPIEFRESIDQFFKITLPDFAGSLNCTINDNFQNLTSAEPAL